MSYTFNVEEISSTSRKININIPAVIVAENYNAVLTDIQAQAQLRGFRKGKAPLALIRKFYAEDIIKKSANKLINDAYQFVLKEINLQIINEPEIEIMNVLNEKEDFSFSATVDINLLVDIKDYHDLSLKLPLNLQKDADTPLSPQEEDHRNNLAFTQFAEQILAKNQFDVAESLIKQAIQNIETEESQGLRQKDAELSVRDLAIKDIKSVLVFGHIARQEGINITDADIALPLIEYLSINNINPNMLRKNNRYLQKTIEEMRANILVRKVILKLLEYANITYEPEVESLHESEEIACCDTHHACSNPEHIH